MRTALIVLPGLPMLLAVLVLAYGRQRLIKTIVVVLAALLLIPIGFVLCSYLYITLASA